MKKILITGINSYVGNSISHLLSSEPNNFLVHKIRVRDNSWKNLDFSAYDVLLHVAGIAHIKETKKNKNMFFQINRDLTIELANKAKLDGIKHFIYISTMSVYGIESGVIDINTKEEPTTNYGQSKLEGEKHLNEIKNDDFIVSILRPPLIYGKDCPGNYSKISKYIKYFKIFPKINNQRSMIYIENLAELVKNIIINKRSGYFYPQNTEYVNTCELVSLISKEKNKKIYLIVFFNVYIQKIKIKLFNKLFGSLVYDKSISDFYLNYNKYNFKESIKRSERV